MLWETVNGIAAAPFLIVAMLIPRNLPRSSAAATNGKGLKSCATGTDIGREVEVVGAALVSRDRKDMGVVRFTAPRL